MSSLLEHRGPDRRGEYLSDCVLAGDAPVDHPMNDKPRISVVIPTYNRAAFVDRAVRSVLLQTLPPDEVIVVDDGSTDATQEVLARFGDPVKVLRLDENVGLGAARNLGARAASGDVLAFLDSDDEWEPHKLAVQVHRSAPGQPSVTGVTLIDDEGEFTGRTYRPPPTAAQDVYVGNPFLGGPSSLAIPRNAFDAVGGFPEERDIAYSSDWLFFVDVIRAGWAVHVIPDLLVRYRVHPGQMTAAPTTVERSVWAACGRLDRVGAGREVAPKRRAVQGAAIAAAFLADRSWRNAARWAGRSLRYGSPVERARTVLWLLRATARSLRRPRSASG